MSSSLSVSPLSLPPFSRTPCAHTHNSLCLRFHIRQISSHSLPLVPPQPHSIPPLSVLPLAAHCAYELIVTNTRGSEGQKENKGNLQFNSVFERDGVTRPKFDEEEDGEEDNEDEEATNEEEEEDAEEEDEEEVEETSML